VVDFALTDAAAIPAAATARTKALDRLRLGDAIFRNLTRAAAIGVLLLLSGVIITDAPGDKSWPVAGSTFILMQTVPTDIASSSEALKFFDWGYKNGKQMATDLDYVPMPDSVVALIEKSWTDKIKSPDGKPVF
jgi:ABC-type phosphate transport system substrate-binding protein